MFKKHWTISLIALLLVVSLAGCTAGGGVMTPDREVSISAEEAMAAQTAGMAGLMAGQAEWTEAQFSSLITELINANTGENNPVNNVTAWFNPGNEIVLSLTLNDGVLLLGNQFTAAGHIDVNDAGQIMIHLTEASAGPYMVSGMMMEAVSAQINGALAQQIAVPVSVETGEGTWMLSLAQ